MDAITIKEISGSCIETIPVGTKFEIIAIANGRYYATCKGLGVSSIWNDEYIINPPPSLATVR